MDKAIFGVVAFALFGTLNLAAQEQQVFKGAICLGPTKPAAVLEKGQTTPQCAANSKRGAKFLLFDSENKAVYQLDHQRKFKDLVGENVLVSGILEKATAKIHVVDVIRAVSSKITQARSVYIDCDACLRGMAAAWPAAFKALTEWGRFDITPDPKAADLIVRFSANPYLGDYLTRDGPDTRPVQIVSTFMDVIDPRTGEGLWADSARFGSWFVADATIDLIFEFKEHLAVMESQDERRLFLLDENRDGKVSKAEFMKFMDAEFDRLDTNGDGYLDADELKGLRVVSVGK